MSTLIYLKKISSSFSRGQLIIEILVAFTLLTFLLSGLIVAGLFAIKNAQFARNKSLATKLATQQLERVRVLRDSQGIKALPSCSNPCYLDNSLILQSTIMPSGIFTQSLNILPNPNPIECPFPTGISVTGYKAVVDVRWDNNPKATPPRQVELNSCFSDWR